MICALIAAAGKGTRIGGVCSKQFIQLGDRPMLAYSLVAFETHEQVDHIFLVVCQDDFDFCRKDILAKLNLKTPVTLVAGGLERQDSVYRGLRAIPEQKGLVLIHDGARPFISQDLISACIHGARRWKACVPAVAATDTLKQVDQRGIIQATIERGAIRLAQTPQVFELPLIREAHERALRFGWQFTDDAAVVERCGFEVRVIDGSPENIKITLPLDLLWAEARLQSVSGKTDTVDSSGSGN
jgi:2-C-methyl-D-erythritol 4-phosphate cytidylyltransferase